MVLIRNKAHPQELYVRWRVSLSQLTKTILNLLIGHLEEVKVIAGSGALQSRRLEQYHSNGKGIRLMGIMFAAVFLIFETIQLLWRKVSTVGLP